MTALSLLQSLFRHQAWAHAELFDAVMRLTPDLHADERDAALRLLGHVQVVARIFEMHLQGLPHGYATDTPTEVPDARHLQAAMADSDRWYLDYLNRAMPEQLAEPRAFVFTDGDHGCMSGAEMLLHVATHGTYHRAEVGRILKNAGVVPPWDTFAVHLHTTQPARRLPVAALRATHSA